MTDLHVARTFAILAVALLGSAGTGSGQELPGNNPLVVAASSPGRMLGLGGRITWMQRALDDPRIWIDGQLFVQPLPRLFVEGGWGRATHEVRGQGPDTSWAETRWDLTLGVVLLQGSASGYVPLVWRKVSQRHSWMGEAEWNEIGTGVGMLVPLRDWLSLKTETNWIAPLRAHDDVMRGTGRESDGSHIEFSLSLLAFVK
jgi:hypothetical protein